ncbi:MAG: hypothetical protein COA50_07550 [Flavobacteriaceae bacterium]|nr:MAG: hypothetical protein COA50_07550 [Flavobacteriaceae bacterium]
MDLGISTFAFAWAIGVEGQVPEHPMTAMDFVKKAKFLGLDRVQFGDNLPLHLLQEDELQQLSDFSKQENIKVEVGTRGLLYNHVQIYLKISEQFGSPFLRIVIDDKNYQPDINEVVETVKKLLPSLRKKNIKLAIENHDRFKALEFVEIVERTDPEWVGICLDPINSLGADQSIGEILLDLAPYTFNLHIKDYSIKRKWHNMGFDTIGTPAGKGLMPIKKIFEILELHKKCYSASLELWPAPKENIEETVIIEARWVEESIFYLKSLLS